MINEQKIIDDLNKAKEETKIKEELERTDDENYDHYLKGLEELKRSSHELNQYHLVKKQIADLTYAVCDSRDRKLPFQKFKWILNEMLKYKPNEKNTYKDRIEEQIKQKIENLKKEKENSNIV